MLLLVTIVLLAVVVALVVQLNEHWNKRDIVKIEEPFVYFTGLDLNSELTKIAEAGGESKVFEFFNTFTENPEVTEVIFEEAILLEVPITSAFALAWGESGYKTQRVNKNLGANGALLSRDWGLYQLNDGHRKKWTAEDFFNVRKNAHEGLSFFKYVLDNFNNEIVLSYAAFNKGVNGLKNGNIPYRTVAHANNIIAYEREMEIKLNYFINRWKHE